MSKNSEELAAQLLEELQSLTRHIECLRSETQAIKQTREEVRDYAIKVGTITGNSCNTGLERYGWGINTMEELAATTTSRIHNSFENNEVIAKLERLAYNLPEVQLAKRRNEVMKETDELEKRELDLKKSIASKQVEVEKISIGLRRVVGFSFVLVSSFTTVGILFPHVWVLCVTTIFVGIITLFVGLNMLFGLHKDGIIDAGKLEKDKVELDYVQTKKAQLFLESNQ